MSGRPQPVHPRVCGELGYRNQGALLSDGSSPRVRGTRRSRGNRGASRRFIPACAGNSTSDHRRAGATTVHPRVCGELQDGADEGLNEGGSSPRVRGTLATRDHYRRHDRFIPACAGNSQLSAGGRRSDSVHPRVCGELPPRFHRVLHFAGSSPRVRGTPTPEALTHINHRFIPACAGNSDTGSIYLHCDPVHPRVCGELDGWLDPSLAQPGSSPRVRGTRADAVGSGRLARFIPACAGNS